jgi:hypothetical protein
MHRLALPLAVVTSLTAGLAAGYYYGSSSIPVSAVVEDYALVNVLEDVAYAHYLAKGELDSMRSMLDVSLNTHLTKVRANSSAVSSPEAEVARTRILNAVAVLWERYPPFQSAEWREGETNKSWWSEWSEGHKQNIAFVREAKAKCATNPALNCKAQTPATRLPAKVN